MNPGKRGLAEAGTDQVTLHSRRGKPRKGKYVPGSRRKGRQRNCRSDQKGCDKQAALVRPNHDPGGIVTWVRRQKYAENGKQQQEDDPDLKSLLHKNHDSTVLGAPRIISRPSGNLIIFLCRVERYLSRLSGRTLPVPFSGEQPLSIQNCCCFIQLEVPK